MPSELDLYTVYHFPPDKPPVGEEIQFVVGRYGKDSGFPHDSGDLPPTYGAHRCHYDVWKWRIATPAKYVGFQEYRRRFKEIPDLDFDIAIFPKIYSKLDLGEQFESCHGGEAWPVLLQALDDITGSQEGTEVKWIVPWDCIITKELFDLSMRFWWDICLWLEPQLDIPKEGYGTRLMSFLSDRIFVIWLVRLMNRFPNLIIREIPQAFSSYGLGGSNIITAI